MKRFLTIILAATCIAAGAQEKSAHNRGDRIMAEKVAFLTNSMQLTVEEAQAFWPLYNKVEAEQHVLWKAERDAFKALSQALKDKKDAKELEPLLRAYVNAQQANVNLHSRNMQAYLKVLPMEKVARFFRANESFRRQQINKLQGHRPQGGPKEPHAEGVPMQNPSALN